MPLRTILFLSFGEGQHAPAQSLRIPLRGYLSFSHDPGTDSTLRTEAKASRRERAGGHSLFARGYHRAPLRNSFFSWVLAWGLTHQMKRTLRKGACREGQPLCRGITGRPLRYSSFFLGSCMGLTHQAEANAPKGGVQRGGAPMPGALYLNSGRDRSSEPWSMLDRPSARSSRPELPEPDQLCAPTSRGRMLQGWA